MYKIQIINMLSVIFQVVLPEGSKDPSAVVPFAVEQHLEVTYLTCQFTPTHTHTGAEILTVCFNSCSLQSTYLFLSHRPLCNMSNDKNLLFSKFFL